MRKAAHTSQREEPPFGRFHSEICLRAYWFRELFSHKFRHAERPAAALTTHWAGIRYRDCAALTLYALRICRDIPQRAAAKGQAVVLYDGEIAVGGGTALETF